MIKMSGKGGRDSGPKLPWKCGAGLQRGTLLLRRLRAAIDGVSGHTQTYAELSDLTGESKSTLGRWLDGDGQPSPETLLRMQEVLPTSLRNQILDEPAFRRCYPTLEHPRISHDSVKLSQLKTILSRPTGLTLVDGEGERLITFLITALGHSCQFLSTERRKVLGLDSHAPDWFVPVPGVTYLDNILQTQKLRQEFAKAWPQITSSKGALVILNGPWAQLPGINEKALALAQNCHIVITQKPPLQPAHKPSIPPTCFINVAEDKSKQLQIGIQER
jgi:hypothetical protein